MSLRQESVRPEPVRERRHRIHQRVPQDSVEKCLSHFRATEQPVGARLAKKADAATVRKHRRKRVRNKKFHSSSLFSWFGALPLLIIFLVMLLTLLMTLRVMAVVWASVMF